MKSLDIIDSGLILPSNLFEAEVNIYIFRRGSIEITFPIKQEDILL